VLLGAVVQVAFDAAAGGIGGGDDPGAGGGEGGLGFGVGDRGGGQFGEPGQPSLAAGRQRTHAGTHEHDAPQPPSDADRHADGRADAKVAGGLGELARDDGVVVDPRWPMGVEHHRLHVPPAEPRSGADGKGCTGAAPGGNYRYRAVGVVPVHRRDFRLRRHQDDAAEPGVNLGRQSALLAQLRPGPR
jgi:hypothetical protein